MQSVDTNAKHTGENMQAAFQDLEAFMARAREMVRKPASISNSKLNAHKRRYKSPNHSIRKSLLKKNKRLVNELYFPISHHQYRPRPH
jgi:ElaB/YqjD/DUF883 family membrane-anchored ribosome-binding protein